MEVVRYLESLTEEELIFLKKKEARDRHHFFRALKAIMIICFVIPFGIAWIGAIAGQPNAFSYKRYFLGVTFLLCFAGLCSYLSYYFFLHKVQQDIRKNTKTIERTRITERRFMPQNGIYYFYLDSPVKLTIEVKEEDYHRLKEGDEVNIEYTTFSQMYLGYF